MLLYAGTIFISAFLVFQIQPLLGRYVLPWYGGTPAVWSTCMLFFQTMLLAGYWYAHLLSTRVKPRLQGPIHFVLLAASLLLLPIIPDPEVWKPNPELHPAPQILLLLTCVIGLPGMMVSATGPLLQKWFSWSYPGRSPYRLYALSNAGSVLALVTYPFLFEPKLRLHEQSWLWSALFILFATGAAAAGMRIRRLTGEANLAESGGTTGPPPPGRGRYLHWLALAALGSVSLLATTNMLCQEVASVPFLWVLPLTIYLATFIICFDSPRWYRRIIAAGLLVLVWYLVHQIITTSAEDPFFAELKFLYVVPLTIPPIIFLLFFASDAWNQRLLEGCMLLVAVPFAVFLLYHGIRVPLNLQILGYSYVLFACCMSCHGELVRAKPEPEHLTAFYLTMACGGALGGVFVALISPLIFSGYWEYHVSVAGCLLLLMVSWYLSGNWRSWLRQPALFWSAIAAFWLLVVYALLFCAGMVELPLKMADALNIYHKVDRPQHNWRNFYGTLHIENDEDSNGKLHKLLNGRIVHGFQYDDPELQIRPTSYYGPDSGIGLGMRLHPRRELSELTSRTLRVALIGLGSGTSLVWGQPGDVMRAYDINPLVFDVAREHFTYWEHSQAEVEPVLGDARIMMERELQAGSQQYDIIAVDAFSSDAIPVHLLTLEAGRIYQQHLKPDGLLGIHISNRFVDLQPVVNGLAQSLQMEPVYVDSPEGEDPGVYDTEWVILTNNKEWINNPEIAVIAEIWTAEEPGPIVWTDDYSSLWKILRYD